MAIIVSVCILGKLGMFEPAGNFAVTPEIFDYHHVDLSANVNKAWLRDKGNIVETTYFEHATLVAGIMVADDNGEGALGIAHDASLAGYYIANDGSDLSALNHASWVA